MSHRFRMFNYIHLALQATFVYLALNYLRAILHEIGHGLAASVVGLRFIGLYGALFGSSYSFNVGPRQPLTAVVISSGGPFIDLCIGLVVLFVILPRLRSWGVRLFGLLLAAATLMAFWGYMMSAAFGSGDFAVIGAILGVPRLAVGIVGILGLVGFLYLVAREIFHALSEYFPLNAFGKRFGTLYLFLGLPATVWVAGTLLVTLRYALLGQFLLVVALLAVLSLLIKSAAAEFRLLPRAPTAAGAAVFAAACALWLGVFGLTYQRAKGVVWGPVEERNVGYCNIHVQLREDLSAEIDVLARPGVIPLFWKKLEKAAPDWTVYTDFIAENLPVLLGTREYSLLERGTDTEASIYLGPRYGRALGCRRISILADLTEVLQEIEPNVYVLEMTDFWRARGRGYIDRLEVTLPEGMALTGYEVEPSDARAPVEFGAGSAVWENEDAETAPERIRVLFSVATVARAVGSRAQGSGVGSP
jgi:hypothetical protein